MFIFRFSVARPRARRGRCLMCPRIPPRFAQVADQPGAALPTIVVTAQHLNEERSRIDTQDGCLHLHLQLQRHPVGPRGGDNRAVEPGSCCRWPDGRAGLLRAAATSAADHKRACSSALNGVIPAPTASASSARTLPPRMNLQDDTHHRKPCRRSNGLRSRRHHRSQPPRGARCSPAARFPCTGGSHGSIEPSLNYAGFERLDDVLHDRRLHSQRSGDRVPGRPPHAAARQHQANITAFGYFRADPRREAIACPLLAGTSNEPVPRYLTRDGLQPRLGPDCQWPRQAFPSTFAR